MEKVELTDNYVANIVSVAQYSEEHKKDIHIEYRVIGFMFNMLNRYMSFSDIEEQLKDFIIYVLKNNDIPYIDMTTKRIVEYLKYPYKEVNDESD